MRAILVDWLVDVHAKFKLLTETLFLTINLIDRYLSFKQITRAKLQLVGVAALLITTKYEEIYPPNLKDFVYITDNAYTKEEILEMESDILCVLDFNLQQTSPYRFLERYTKVMKCDSVAFYLSQYLLELGLLDSKMAKFLPSEQAAAAVLYAERKLKRTSSSSAFLAEWQKMEKHSGYSLDQLAQCFHVFESLVRSMN
jgi:cyclin B